MAVHEGRVLKLRDEARGPVYGVRTRVTCGCGVGFFTTLTVGVNFPVVWCPRCRQRSRLRLQWRVEGTVRAGAVIRWVMH